MTPPLGLLSSSFDGASGQADDANTGQRTVWDASRRDGGGGGVCECG